MSDAPEQPTEQGSPEAQSETTTETSTALAQPGMKWYVLRVASNKEEQVRDALLRKVKIEQLEDRIGRILVPTLKEKRMRAGVLRVVEGSSIRGTCSWRWPARRTARSRRTCGF